MSDADAHVAKWLARDPAMELAQVFCPPLQRRAFMLWGALCEELDEAVFELGDATVAQAKLAWWGDELAHGVRGAARHPLVRDLFALDAARGIDAAACLRLAHAAIGLSLDDATAIDLDALLQRSRGYAAALAQLEATLFGAPSPVDALVVERLLRRLPPHAERFDATRLRWPLQLLARHQFDPAAPAGEGALQARAAILRDIAADLLARLPQPRDASLFRCCRSALVAARLERIARGAAPRQHPGRIATLWRLWRTARRRNGVRG